VVLAGSEQTSDRPARGLVERLGELGVETMYLGREQSAHRIAAVVVEERADAVELCLEGLGGVSLLRELLRELIRVGRRDVSIVVHRAGPPTTSLPVDPWAGRVKRHD
jgi:methylmalonyl-CoA mutase cobalamin-binding subunit